MRSDSCLCRSMKDTSTPKPIRCENDGFVVRFRKFSSHICASLKCCWLNFVAYFNSVKKIIENFLRTSDKTKQKETEYKKANIDHFSLHIVQANFYWNFFQCEWILIELKRETIFSNSLFNEYKEQTANIVFMKSKSLVFFFKAISKDVYVYIVWYKNQPNLR